jgi:hypothetical protein
MSSCNSLVLACVVTAITETKEGHMLVGKAIRRLHLDTKLVGGIACRQHLYLDELCMVELPKSGMTLDTHFDCK